MGKFIPFERYRIILRHEYFDGNGDYHDMEEPRVVEYAIMRGMGSYPVPVLIEEMMDKMKRGLLNLVNKEAE